MFYTNYRQQLNDEMWELLFDKPVEFLPITSNYRYEQITKFTTIPIHSQTGHLSPGISDLGTQLGLVTYLKYLVFFKNTKFLNYWGPW